MEERNSYNVSATCYGLKAAKRYGVDVVHYGILAGDVKNMKHLGNLACSNFASCFGQIQSAIQVKLYFDTRWLGMNNSGTMKYLVITHEYSKEQVPCKYYYYNLQRAM